MKARQSSARPAKSGRHHPLILQQHLNEQIFWPSIVVVAITAALLIWNPPRAARYRPYLSIALAGTGFVLILTFLYRLRAYVQCRQDGLCVQLPFYRLTIPYSSIRATRPNEFFRLFPPEEQRWTQRSFLHGLWGTTVVLVELHRLPHPRPWLRLWMSKYMLDPNEPGLALSVRDWIALRSELDESLSRHRRNTHRP